jgi:penicillin amidase
MPRPDDLFRAQGYVRAQDRFWEWTRRHLTAGRLSELFGSDQVDSDAFIRTLAGAGGRAGGLCCPGTPSAPAGYAEASTPTLPITRATGRPGTRCSDAEP